MPVRSSSLSTCSSMRSLAKSGARHAWRGPELYTWRTFLYKVTSEGVTKVSNKTEDSWLPRKIKKHNMCFKCLIAKCLKYAVGHMFSVVPKRVFTL